MLNPDMRGELVRVLAFNAPYRDHGQRLKLHAACCGAESRFWVRME